MIRLALAILFVARGRVGRIAAPGKWRVWRDDAGLHIEITTTKGRAHGA